MIKFIKTRDEDNEFDNTNITFEIPDGDVTRDVLIEEFVYFLKACTYQVNQKEELMFVNVDEFKDDEEIVIDKLSLTEEQQEELTELADDNDMTLLSYIEYIVKGHLHNIKAEKVFDDFHDQLVESTESSKEVLEDYAPEEETFTTEDGDFYETKSKFKVGDRVVHKDYGTGTLKGTLSIGWWAVEFDNYFDGHSSNGLCKDGYGWDCLETNLKLIEQSVDQKQTVDKSIEKVVEQGKDVIDLFSHTKLGVLKDVVLSNSIVLQSAKDKEELIHCLKSIYEDLISSVLIEAQKDHKDE